MTNEELQHTLWMVREIQRVLSATGKRDRKKEESPSRVATTAPAAEGREK